MLGLCELEAEARLAAEERERLVARAALLRPARGPARERGTLRLRLAEALLALARRVDSVALEGPLS